MPACQPSRIRFHFTTGSDRSPQEAEIYYRDLIEAELLLDRALASASAGVRPIHPRLDAEGIVDAMERPARARVQHERGTPEYVRWFEDGGVARARPLTKEDLTQALIRDRDMPVAAAEHLVSMHSHALSAMDQAWVERRFAAPVGQRPLDASEFRHLVRSLEAAFCGAHGQSEPVRGNAALSVRAAGILGRLFDEFQPSPFASFELSRAYQQGQLGHLQERAEAARAECERAVPVGKSAVEAARMVVKRAEWSVQLADRAVRGVQATPAALSVRLETADGREIWWSVMARDPDGVVNSAVCEAIVRPADYEIHEGDGETVRFLVDVHGDDGAILDRFEGSGDAWRQVESGDATAELYRRLLAGDHLDDVLLELAGESLGMEYAA